MTDAERRYGHAPAPDPTVVYQPEVVIIEGGAQAIRGLDANGLGCTIDALAQPVTKAINFVLSTLNIKHQIGSSGGLQTEPQEIVNKRGWEPDLPVCKLT